MTDATQMGRGIKAIVTIKLADHGTKARKRWIEELENTDAVSQIYAVSGDIDVIVIMTVGSMAQFQSLSKKLYGDNENVLQFVSQFVLEEHKFDIAN
ncbi:Lrp/AsnC ligand binding domain-containing protein [Rhodobacteraceae bacterium]|nr:Lrp/AsnC ligand binding domain-containing protein [Paracoccaceae bacterium]